MSDLEQARALSADQIWADVVRDTGIWLAPYSDAVADFGRLLIPKMRDALAAARREGAEEMREGLLSSLSYPNRSALRENVRENLEQQYANIFGKQCSTDAARRLAECALETTVDFLVRALPVTPEEPVRDD